MCLTLSALFAFMWWKWSVSGGKLASLAAVHRNTSKNINAIMLTTAKIDDKFCLVRVVIVNWFSFLILSALVVFQLWFTSSLSLSLPPSSTSDFKLKIRFELIFSLSLNTLLANNFSINFFLAFLTSNKIKSNFFLLYFWQWIYFGSCVASDLFMWKISALHIPFEMYEWHINNEKK